EIVLGIVIGPEVLGWVSIDTPIQVLSLLGLAFLLFLAGLEVEYERFRGRLLRLTALGYATSFGLALLIGLGLHAGGLVKSPLLIGIALSATTLGIVIPVLKDAGQVTTPFGQLVVAGSSIAEIASIILLSLFFSGEAGGIGVKLLLLGLFGLLLLAVGVAVRGRAVAGNVAQHPDRCGPNRCATRSSSPRRLRGACRSRPLVGGALPGDGPDAAPLGRARAKRRPRGGGMNQAGDDDAMPRRN